jgi:glycosyltransferase involved in cell wall biosynthesis
LFNNGGMSKVSRGREGGQWDVHESHRSLSVVIASYNSAQWLPSTIRSACAALIRTSWSVEFIVVDDGSNDGTTATLEGLAPDLPYPLKIVTQTNQGRFLARWEGVQAASHGQLLILDSRLLVHDSSFAYLEGCLAEVGEMPWNGHVITESTSPLVGQFWLVPTHVFWSEYLSRPRAMLINPENFDRVPKGTGFLFIRKEQFARACEYAWPTTNAHLTSDDTKLLRFVVSESPIRLDPGFAATYRPRTTLGNFLKHSFARGTLFVDSYAGTSLARDLILLALAGLPVLFLFSIAGLFSAGRWEIALGVSGLAIGLALVPAVIAAGRNCPRRALVSYVAFVLPFGVTFVSGLVRGLFVHRRSFSRKFAAKEVTK